MPADPILKPPSTPPWEEHAERRHLAVIDAFTHLAHTCREISRLITAHAPRVTSGEARTLSAIQPWNVDRKGYHYLRVWATASTTVTVDAGAGPTSLTLNAGWNNVDWPQGSTVKGSGNLFVEYTDYYPVQ